MHCHETSLAGTQVTFQLQEMSVMIPDGGQGNQVGGT